MDQHSTTISETANVEAELLYIAPLAGRAHSYTYDPPPGVPRTNTVDQPHRVLVRDARPFAAGLSLDREGFELVAQRSAVRDFYDEDELRRVYYPEAEKLVTAHTGAARVVIFDHTIRRRHRGVEDRAAGMPRQPASRVHNDYTEHSAPQRIRDLMGDEAAALLGRRYQFINVWRPIRGPLRDAPLAMCDARSLSDGDLLPSDLIYRDRTGEIYLMRHNPKQRWFYVPAMRADEALLLKCYDSARDGRAVMSPHGAFEDPTAPADVLPRESIELRTIAFHDV
ncbi:MAG: CmcJ/NvfI family oxidoreductase [Acetobacteraceae bacterium]